MLQDIPVPFGEWLPDLGENNNPGLVEAKNVIARPGGYAPLPSLTEAVSVSNMAITDDEEHVRYFGYSSGVNGFYASIDSLQIGTNAASAVTSRSGFYGGWFFATFGRSVYGIRQFLSSSTNALYYADAGDTAFTNFTTTPLSASAIARVGNFLMIGATDTGDGQFEFRWSGFNQPLSWTASQTTQAGRADVQRPELGVITGIHGGRYGIIFQNSGATRIDYVGPPKVWNGTIIDADYGCLYHNTIIPVGDLVYYLSRVGPMVSNGASVERLGTGRVSDWFLANFDETDREFLHVGRDMNKDTIVWSWSTSDGTDGTFRQLVYSLETGRFSYGTIDTPRLLMRFSQLGFLDDQGLVGLRNTSGTLIPSRDGDSLAAEVTTGYTTLTPGKRTRVNAVEPVYDGAGAKVAVNTKATQAGAVSTGTPVAVNSQGIANLTADGRLAAVSVTYDAAADWSELKGAVVTADTSGAR